MISVIILILASASEGVESYAEKNGWVEIDPPRPDLQCWRRDGRPDAICANPLTSTYGASNGNN